MERSRSREVRADRRHGVGAHPGPAGRRRGAAMVAIALLLTFLAGPADSRQRARDEADRLAELLQLAADSQVAEIGAGAGRMTVEIATRLGSEGRVYSTELSEARLADIRRAVDSAGLGNVSVIEAAEDGTNLPEACCDAIFMRTVYHHLTQPAEINQSLHRALRPGGLLAIIDFPPRGRRDRAHGITPDEIVEEVTQAGFELAHRIDDWSSRNFLVLFRRTGA